ncbi:hypothetical protein GOV03_00910, partial [Candidatus Woesearchaeota archaeon]|nr:hypothetical protein [Candidatus Woesearchaeota archaeon]
DFFNINKGGVVAAFWGVDLLDYARIYDLDNSTEYTPHFNLDSNGKIIIPDEVCGSAPSDPRALKETVAMKQILEQSIALKGWQTAEDREDKYYIVTPYHGCCRLGKGGYKIDLTELERSVLRP